MPLDQETTRRQLLSRGVALVAGAAMVSGTAPPAEARDYATKREALDELDRLASTCGLRLRAVQGSRGGVDVLVSRFLAVLERHRVTRDDVRKRFAMPMRLDPERPPGEVDADLAGLRQCLDDLMVAYAESLPVFGDSNVVSRLAVDMVEVSKLRTVIDLWVESEAA